MKKEPFMLVPQGDPVDWQSFMADDYEMVWPNGGIGRKGFVRTPSETEKKNLLMEIDIAIRKVEEYKKELEAAREALQCQTK